MVTVAEIGLSFVHEMRNTGPKKKQQQRKKKRPNKQTKYKYNIKV